MFKKFLANIALAALLVTTAATSVMAATVTGTPVGTDIQSYIDNFEVSSSAINPNASESITISYDIEADADVYLYALSPSYGVSALVGSGLVYEPTTADSYNVSWYATENNVEGAAALEDGEYKIRISAKVDGNTVDEDFAYVTVDSTGVIQGEPEITNLTADPLDFEAGDEDTEISFDVDQDAYLTLLIDNNNANTIKTFEDYSYDWYDTDDIHSISWNGTDDDGADVEAGTYTVYVLAENDNGVSWESINIEVIDADNPTPSPTPPNNNVIIKDLEIDPENDWDPTEEDLEIEFELTEEVSSLEVELVSPNGKTIELLKEEDADDDDYDLTWDGTDDDGDYVKGGEWLLIVRADNETEEADFEVEYTQPEITQSFVSKSSIDTDKGEFTNLAFTLNTESVVTVEVYKGSKKKLTLLDEKTLSEDDWHTIVWAGDDEDGDYVKDANDWKFKITAENKVDDDINDVEIIEIDIEEDDVSSKKSNVTNDFTTPVIFDDDRDDSIIIYYCLEEDAEVSIDVYEGTSTSGSSDVELLDKLAQTEGCHWITWDVTDEDGDDLDEDIYSYKIMSKANGSYKDTETGIFAVGEEATSTTVEPPSKGCENYTDTKNIYDVEICSALEWVTNEGIFHGYADGSFGPQNYINRAEVLKVLIEAMDNVNILPLDGTNQGFSDLDPNAWYMPYVRTAKFYGMLHGYPDGEAKLANNINRAEILKLALEAADAFEGYTIPNAVSSSYTDVADDVWFVDYANVAYTYILFDDYNIGTNWYLSPANLVTRSEVALLLYRMHMNGLI